MAINAGYAITMESRISRSNGSRRGDIIVQRGGQQKQLVLDVTVGLPTCSSYVVPSSTTQRYTIGKLEYGKNRLYKVACERDNMKFMPCAFESFGAWSESFTKLFNSWIERMEMRGLNKHTQQIYWSRRISCTIQKFNSRTIINKIAEISAFKRKGDEAFHGQFDAHGELCLDE